MFKELKKQCLEANLMLPNLGLVIQTFGNVSIVDRKKRCFAIKPSGVPYADLKKQDIVIVDFDNRVVDGAMNPSSDTKTHAYLYKQWKNIGSIVHTHSTYAVAWSQAQMPIPILGTTHADHLVTDIPCIPPMDNELIKGDYEYNTGVQIKDYFSSEKLNPKEVQMVLVGNHGPFSWGENSKKAVYNSQILEELAKMAYLTLQINPIAPKLKSTLIEKHYQRKHGANPYYGQKK